MQEDKRQVTSSYVMPTQPCNQYPRSNNIVLTPEILDAGLAKDGQYYKYFRKKV